MFKVEAPSYRFIPLSEAIKELGGISRASAYRMSKDGRLPPMDHVGRKAGYFADKLTAWRQSLARGAK